jgi:PilZ domain
VTPRPGVERRRVARVPVGSGSPVSVVGAQLLDVSCFGMTIESPILLEGGTVMRFRLVVAGEQADLDARVMNCQSSWRGSRRVFEVGLEFQGMPAPLRDRLAEVLRSLSSSVA